MLAVSLLSLIRLLLTILKHGAKLSAATGLVVAVACGDRTVSAGSVRGGAIIVAVTQDPQNLFPPTTDRSVAKAVTELVFDKLADLGPDLNTLGDAGFQPRLASSWEWSQDSLAVTFHLNPRARWQDGPPVRASDVRFALAVYTDTLVGSRSGADLRTRIDSISVSDSLTCTAWFKERTPENFYNLVIILIPLPEHLLGRAPHDSLAMSTFARFPVGNGPYRFVRWEPEQRVEIAASASYYRGRPNLDRVIWTIAPSMSSVVRQLLAGGVDFFEELPPENLPAAARNRDLRLMSRTNYNYGFLQFNLRDHALDRPHPLFSERELRRALTRALDRPTLVRSVFDSLGSVARGPFVRAQWASDSTMVQLRFDRTAAARTLDSLGWRLGAGGLRSRRGRPLAFTLLVPTGSANRMRAAPIVQEQLRQVGIKVELELLDDNAFIARRKSRQFDAILQSLSTSPSPSGIRQTWTTSAAREGGFNDGKYENSVFDALVDSALAAGDMHTARAQYRAAYQIILDDAPAIWLYEPRPMAAIRRRLHTGALRGDAWWAGLPAWSIASGDLPAHDTASAKAP